MTTRKRALTAQIKPATRNAIMDQLALAADRIMAERFQHEAWKVDADLAAEQRRKRDQFWLGVWLIAFGATGMLWLVTI